MAARNPSSEVRSNSSFEVDAALGRLISQARKPLINFNHFGLNPNVGTTQEGIWAQGGPFVWLLAPEFLRIKAGGDIEDGEGDVGAITVKIEGIGADLKMLTETLTLRGVTASVHTANKFFRIYRASVELVGTYGARNTGDISIETVDTAQVVAKILAGASVTHLAVFSTSDDYCAIISSVEVYVEGNKTVDLELGIREGYDIVNAPFNAFVVQRNFVGLGGAAPIIQQRQILQPTSDLCFNATATTGTAGVFISFDLLLIPLS